MSQVIIKSVYLNDLSDMVEEDVRRHLELCGLGIKIVRRKGRKKTRKRERWTLRMRK